MTQEAAFIGNPIVVLIAVLLAAAAIHALGRTERYVDGYDQRGTHPRGPTRPLGCWESLLIPVGLGAPLSLIFAVGLNLPWLYVTSAALFGGLIAAERGTRQEVNRRGRAEGLTMIDTPARRGCFWASSYLVYLIFLIVVLALVARYAF